MVLLKKRDMFDVYLRVLFFFFLRFTARCVGLYTTPGGVSSELYAKHAAATSVLVCIVWGSKVTRHALGTATSNRLLVVALSILFL